MPQRAQFQDSSASGPALHGNHEPNRDNVALRRGGLLLECSLPPTDRRTLSLPPELRVLLGDSSQHIRVFPFVFHPTCIQPVTKARQICVHGISGPD